MRHCLSNPTFISPKTSRFVPMSENRLHLHDERQCPSRMAIAQELGIMYLRDHRATIPSALELAEPS